MEAVRCGADGILVSNHGGRQLSSTAGTVRILITPFFLGQILRAWSSH